MIRKLNPSDYDQCVDLMKRNGMAGDYSLEELLSGLGFVYVSPDGDVVGFMWALVSKKVAVLDILVVDEDYRSKDLKCKRGTVPLNLAAKMMAELHGLGVTKFIGILDKNVFNYSMLRFYRESLGMTEREPFAVVKGNPLKVCNRLCANMEVVYG